MKRRQSTGFTLLEVLVALALIATALGGTLAVMRQALATQTYLERRLFAQWVADNALNQYALERSATVEPVREGREAVLGRVYRYTIQVTPVPVATNEVTSVERGMDDEPGLNSAATAPAFDDVVVEVRDAPSLGTPLARSERQLERETGT